jgi:hypothetical protein
MCSNFSLEFSFHTLFGYTHFLFLIFWCVEGSLWVARSRIATLIWNNLNEQTKDKEKRKSESCSTWLHSELDAYGKQLGMGFKLLRYWIVIVHLMFCNHYTYLIIINSRNI